MMIPTFIGGSSSFKKNYLLELEIPCINLKELVYDIGSWENDVDFHVELLESSDLDKNVYFFAAHSGGGEVSYFNDLIKVKVGDFIVIRIGEELLSYVVVECYSIFKNGYLEVEDDLYDILYLITCSVEEKDKQLVVRAQLV